ncbi:succinate--CoA ligase subunit alpha [Candidatus Aciduliprofundum boonei]|uniref:Succinate--CoA ligase [ADP-forming] subunit alpha n=1 Tax=Aciduliprofundum boonei (strain DSM 19572 / T469) TaxID=439481 RepID=D3T9L7_ACIB4|nr:succinate--CoA ligase subunit alpha [Candidatus Aciduliprofundum boonei]ADD08796.1 succinyl-CoA synthetase, alpha subunit [Aciduliprofundum boonei T469]HII55694.1 succinate--CoA ligase subunit alpha [Candidatus Aciduliprofundum boonei]
MSVIIDENTKIIVQGITGHQGSFHSGEMIKFGAKVVAGVTPGKGGMKVHNVPVYDTVEETLVHEPEATMITVPAPFVKDAAFEAMYNGIRVVYILTEKVPLHDALDIVTYARSHGHMVIGPNGPGITVPGKTKMGIMPNHIFKKGTVAVASRSGTLTYEIVNALTLNGYGQSTVIGLGGDRITGLNFVDILELFEKDEDTEAIVLVGEIGGTAEEEAAEYIKKNVSKPVVAYIAGRSAPPGKRMGHAGAIITRGKGTAESKIKAFNEAGVPVAEFPWEIPQALKKVYK